MNLMVAGIALLAGGVVLFIFNVIMSFFEGENPSEKEMTTEGISVWSSVALVGFGVMMILLDIMINEFQALK